MSKPWNIITCSDKIQAEELTMQCGKQTPVRGIERTLGDDRQEEYSKKHHPSLAPKQLVFG